MRFLFSIGLLGVMLSVGCASGPKPSTKHGKPIFLSTPKPIWLKIKSPKKTRKEKVIYHSHAYTKTYEDSQLRKEKEDIIDFTVEAKILKQKKGRNNVTQIVTVTEKDGFVPLHDLAFPELGEKLRMILTPFAEVKRAGKFPTNSIFYVPPISLPKGPVSVGDTWVMKKKWVSMNNGMPFDLEMVSIFNALMKCGPNSKDECVDLEISGRVAIPGNLIANTYLDSTIKGRLVFNRTKGAIIWGDIRSHEKLRIGNGLVDVISCLSSRLEEPKADRWIYKDIYNCNPKVELDETVY